MLLGMRSGSQQPHPGGAPGEPIGLLLALTIPPGQPIGLLLALTAG